MISRQVLHKLDCPKNDINPKEVAFRKATVSIISSPIEIIDNSGNATIILPNGTTLHLEDVLPNSRLKRNLHRFKMYAIMDTILRH